MSAARPSQAVINNAMMAIVASGHNPGAVQVNPDGSFRVEVLPSGAAAASTETEERSTQPMPLTWEEAA